MYHSISDRGPGQFERTYALPERIFRAHLDLLRLLKMPVLPIDALLEDPRRRGVILTFDDAYEDFATTAWPLLRSRGYPAAVMVPTAHVGGRDGWNEETAPRLRPLMGWETLRRLRAEGVAVESHSDTHPDLRAIPLDRAEDELRRSRERIEAELGEAPRFVAYPFNRTSPELARAVERAGYAGALSGHWTDDGLFSRRRYDAGSAGIICFAAELLGLRDTGRRLKRSPIASAVRAPLQRRSRSRRLKEPIS
jgi:peptidoglycan/xylan/chitin deacetylase (PgdA/CDA1 family)